MARDKNITIHMNRINLFFMMTQSCARIMRRTSLNYFAKKMYLILRQRIAHTTIIEEENPSGEDWMLVLSLKNLATDGRCGKIKY